MRLGGKVTTESLGLDREAKHAEICAKSRADILGHYQKDFWAWELITNITVTRL